LQKIILLIIKFFIKMKKLTLFLLALTGSGAGVQTIHGYELHAGMYLYSLIADNQLIDTKRMILTK